MTLLNSKGRHFNLQRIKALYLIFQLRDLRHANRTECAFFVIKRDHLKEIILTFLTSMYLLNHFVIKRDHLKEIILTSLPPVK